MKRGTTEVTWKESDYKNLLYENITYKNQISIVDELDFQRYIVGMGYIKGRELGQVFGIVKEFSWLNDVNYAVHKIHPGQVLPYHRDHYVKYKEVYQISNADHIERIILFLEDWKPGHLLGVENNIVSNWSAGDWVSWNGEAIHMAANLGHHDRYTLQITGHRK